MNHNLSWKLEELLEVAVADDSHLRLVHESVSGQSVEGKLQARQRHDCKRRRKVSGRAWKGRAMQAFQRSLPGRSTTSASNSVCATTPSPFWSICTNPLRKISSTDVSGV